MTNEKVDILIYVPFKEEDLNEKEIKWIKSFQAILNVAINQINRSKVILSTSYLKDLSKQTDLTCLIQLIIKKDFEPGSLLKGVKTKKAIHVKCHPEIKIEESDDKIMIVNLFDEALNKYIDLSTNIEELKNEIWLKFLDIAYELRKVLIKETEKKQLKRKIFLAETSADQSYNRETIKRELEHLGYEVLPESGLSNDMLIFSEQVQNDLKQCFLSIHLIGNYYAPLLKNIDISSIELQNDLFHETAAELKAENKVIKRLVWIPPDIKPKSEKQKLYIESFKRNIELLKNTEIIQTPIEVFKNIVKQKAEETVELKVQKTEVSESSNKSVYIVSNDIRNKYFKEIKEVLSRNKVEILEAGNASSKIDLIQEHYRNLINCDALLIDYSVDNNQWLNSKLSDIIKSPGFGRKKSFMVKSVFINTERTPNLGLSISDLEIDSDTRNDIAKRLKPFIEKIT